MIFRNGLSPWLKFKNYFSHSCFICNIPYFDYMPPGFFHFFLKKKSCRLISEKDVLVQWDVDNAKHFVSLKDLTHTSQRIKQLPRSSMKCGQILGLDVFWPWIKTTKQVMQNLTLTPTPTLTFL